MNMTFRQYYQNQRYATFMLSLISNISQSLGNRNICIASRGRRENMKNFICPPKLSFAKQNFLYLNKMQDKFLYKYI